MKQASIAAAIGSAMALSSGTALAGRDIDAIKAPGSLVCGEPDVVRQAGNCGGSDDRHVGPNFPARDRSGREQASGAGRYPVRPADPLSQGV
jgi:hypothetical protein